MQVFGIVNCGSVKKAREFFAQHGVSYDFIDFKKTPPSAEMVRAWVEQKGIEVVLNKKGTTYKKLALKDKNLSLEEQIQYCVENPSLIKRPVVQKDSVLIFGFDAELYAQELL